MSARLHCTAVKSDIYSYLFDYEGTVSKSNLRTMSDIDIGVSHGDDTIYILKVANLDTVSTEKDKHMSRMLLDLTTSFMKFRKPNITSEWRAIKKSLDAPYYQLKISGPTEYEMMFEKEIGQGSFWRTLPFKENQNLPLHAHDKDEL